MKVIPFEHLRYKVPSESDPNIEPYLVDVLEGICDCPDYVKRRAGRTGPDRWCKHIHAARQVALDELLDNIRAHANKGVNT